MSNVPAFAARLRGAGVGIVAGAAAVPAHSLAGGMLPSTGMLVLVLAGCAGIGLMSAARGTTLRRLIGQLVVGQGALHLLLSVGSGHVHVPSAAMAAGHLGVAVLVGLGLWCAEHLIRVLLTSIRRVLRLLAVSASDAAPARRPVTHAAGCAPTLLSLASGRGTRGPPQFCAA
ncbi:hypothetical protein GIY30_24165 [Gordonia sp. HNM0687]|uniref:Uncharacterized protein n=1 Tax=Gordonia mangrovi TaxID=2665643 RepID=A0A6L7GWX1_9ACTN|nr:hypothetical protein [Gordonia mangrovi]MXP24420.1 hypothetical protein [Gordonia mangrovi]UVF79964.1 hypothetical protein NWF22_09150 [Gordonia mangrovi]